MLTNDSTHETETGVAWHTPITYTDSRASLLTSPHLTSPRFFVRTSISAPLAVRGANSPVRGVKSPVRGVNSPFRFGNSTA
eukprot:3559520-Pyramimonas_sp.AAC.1